MPVQPTALVEAFLNKDLPQFLEFETHFAAKPHELAYIQALRSYLEMDLLPHGYQQYSECEQSVRKALSEPIEDLPILILVLGIAVLLQAHSGTSQEAEMLL
jgi:hypothetical protein